MNRRTLLKAIPAALASAAGGKAQEMSKGKKSGVKAKAMDDKKKDRHALAALLICLKSDSKKISAKEICCVRIRPHPQAMDSYQNSIRMCTQVSMIV